MSDTLVIANCSGFLGDRLSAAREMVEGGEIDVLTGDYLAELTMALLFRMKTKSPDKGYAVPFLKQMEEVMGTCLDRGIKIVANAGGINTLGLVRELEDLGKILGLSPRVAAVTGDDLMPALGDLQAGGEPFTHLETGEELGQATGEIITANAYLGGWGIALALGAGADIVVGGRMADAALVAGPCAWKFKWQRDDWDCLAGAYAAGHIIECGTQATGGNYAFIDEVPSYKNMGFPMAEMHADGSFVITKHPGTGGLVSTGTVTAQLLYEIGPQVYQTPDVGVRLDTLELEDQGSDRVRVTGARGVPPTDTAKVCINTLWGYQNTMTVVLTGLDIGKKAAIVEESLFERLGGRDQFARAHVQLIRSDREQTDENNQAFAHLRITVMDPDPGKVGKVFSGGVVEMMLASVPGFITTTPPGNASPAIRHWPALVGKDKLLERVHVDGQVHEIAPVIPSGQTQADVLAGLAEVGPGNGAGNGETASGSVCEIPLGRVFAARSGDKGGNANLGVWARDDAGYAFLEGYLSEDRLKTLLPDLASYQVRRYCLPNLKALNFVVHGLLGYGVAASVRTDPQGKTLGEYLRARPITVPASLVDNT
ncbi:MAG: acyclic terpene utilization AtuA family protein [Desulfobacter sp.]